MTSRRWVGFRRSREVPKSQINSNPVDLRALIQLILALVKIGPKVPDLGLYRANLGHFGFNYPSIPSMVLPPRNCQVDRSNPLSSCRYRKIPM